MSYLANLLGGHAWTGEDGLDRAQRAISSSLESLGGSARVAVLKAIVSQASAAIPVVPLYVALLFRVMKDQGVLEDCIAHISRLFGTQLKPGAEQRLDDSDRIRMDDQELTDEIQQEVRAMVCRSDRKSEWRFERFQELSQIFGLVLSP